MQPVPMKRATLAVAIGLPLALVAAWRMQGSLGTGVLAGFATGVAVAGLGLVWQAHVLRTNPRDALGAAALSFLAKLFVLLIGGLCFRYVEPAARWVDYRSFLLTFVLAAALLLLAGVPETVQVLTRRRTP